MVSWVDPLGSMNIMTMHQIAPKCLIQDAYMSKKWPFVTSSPHPRNLKKKDGGHCITESYFGARSWCHLYWSHWEKHTETQHVSVVRPLTEKCVWKMKEHTSGSRLRIFFPSKWLTGIIWLWPNIADETVVTLPTGAFEGAAMLLTSLWGVFLHFLEAFFSAEVSRCRYVGIFRVSPCISYWLKYSWHQFATEVKFSDVMIPSFFLRFLELISVSLHRTSSGSGPGSVQDYWNLGVLQQTITL